MGPQDFNSFSEFSKVTSVSEEVSTSPSPLAVQNHGNGPLLNLVSLTKSSETESTFQTTWNDQEKG